MIYTASKTKHAHIWLKWRKEGFPIISSWIDEAGQGQSKDLRDLAIRCIDEVKKCDIFIIYSTGDDDLHGALIELGAAISLGKLIISVGDLSKERSCFNLHPSIMGFYSLENAKKYIQKNILK